MRTKSALLTAALVFGTTLAAACSVNDLTGGHSALPGSPALSRSPFHSRAERSGIAPQYLRTLRAITPTRGRHGGKLKDLAVTDDGLNEILFFNSNYLLTEIISDSGPDGDFIDAKGNLYVANYSNINVTEYNKRGSLIDTYSSGLSDPVDVTADQHGNIFVADYGVGAASVVVEYAQGNTTPIESCNTGLANDGVAVDNAGDVFVSGNNPNTGSGSILEYAGGLSSCSDTTLGVALGFGGGLQLDKHKDLVACDQLVGVDIIPPPYSSIRSTITGPADSFHAALTEKNDLIFIADPNSNEVWVDDYPSGTNVTTIGGSNGVSLPYGVATYPYQK